MPVAEFKTHKNRSFACFFTVVSPRPQEGVQQTVLQEHQPLLFCVQGVTQLSLNLRITRLFLPVLSLQQTGLYAYKVFGVMEECPPDLLADVYMDLVCRKQWDLYVEGE